MDSSAPLKTLGRVAGALLASGLGGFMCDIWTSRHGALKPSGFRFWGPRSQLLPQRHWALGHLRRAPPACVQANTSGPAGKSHRGFSLAAAPDPICLVELSKRARESLQAKCRLLEDEIHDPGSMIS